MPWLNSIGRVGSTVSTGSGSLGLEKLEDRIAVAATATLAASGLIFDGATQAVVAAPSPAQPVYQGIAVAPSHAHAPTEHHHKPAKPKHGKGAGGGHARRHGGNHGGHKKQSAAGGSSGSSTKSTKAVSGSLGGASGTKSTTSTSTSGNTGPTSSS